jgi:hypothetical protein
MLRKIAANMTTAPIAIGPPALSSSHGILINRTSGFTGAPLRLKKSLGAPLSLSVDRQLCVKAQLEFDLKTQNQVDFYSPLAREILISDSGG